MGDAIRELFVSIGLSGEAAEEMDHLHEKVSELGEKFKEFGEVVITALGAEKIYEFVEAQAELGAQVLHLSERLGIEADQLQKLGYAAEQGGGSMESMGASLKFLQRNMSQAAKGGALGAVFKKAGIEVKNADGSLRSASDVMGDLADAIKALPPGAERTALAMKVMGRQGASMIPILAQGRAGLEAMGKEAESLGGVMSEEYLEAAHHAEQQSVKLNTAWKGMKATIAMELFPAFSDFTENLAKHVAGLRDLIKNTTFVRTALIGVAGLASLKVVPAFLSLAKSIAGVSKEAGFMETAMGLGTFALIAAGVILLLLVFDDLWGMFEGKDSLIGGVIDEFFGFGESKALVDDIKNSLDALWDSVDGLSNAIGFDLKGTVGSVFGDYFRNRIAAIADQLDTVFRVIAAVIKSISGVVKLATSAGKNAGKLAVGDQGAMNELLNIGSGTLDDITKGWQRATPNNSAWHQTADEHAANAARANRDRTAYKNATQNNHVTVNQYGVKDPRAEAADGVRTALDEKEYDDSFSSLGIVESDQ